jgi:hypothetical protein
MSQDIVAAEFHATVAFISRKYGHLLSLSKNSNVLIDILGKVVLI